MMSGTTKTFDGGLTSGGSPIGVGIDQSFTGFGLTAMADTGEYYTWVYKSGERGVDRLLDIRHWLEETLLDIGTHRIEDIAIEAPVRMSQAALISGQLFATVQTTVRTLFGPSDPGYPIQVPPSTLKKYVTGGGKAAKNEMLLHTYKKWGAEFTDDNAADSYGLARIANKIADVAYEQQVLKTLEDPKFRTTL